MDPDAADRVVMILHSGAYDRASYALSLAGVALASGSEAHILLTYGGLRRFTRGHLEELGEETSAEVRAAVMRGRESGGMRPLAQALTEAKLLGLKLYACPSAMANLNISRDELVPEVDQVMGLAAFMERARGAAINWYI